jgi:hypothetical protein
VVRPDAIKPTVASKPALLCATLVDGTEEIVAEPEIVDLKVPRKLVSADPGVDCDREAARGVTQVGRGDDEGHFDLSLPNPYLVPCVASADERAPWLLERSGIPHEEAIEPERSGTGRVSDRHGLATVPATRHDRRSDRDPLAVGQRYGVRKDHFALRGWKPLEQRLLKPVAEVESLLR